MKSLLNYFKLLISSTILIFVSANVFAQDWVYTVVEGDNLWNLSKQHLDKVTRFEQIRKLNDISDPKLLPPGTRIRIPLKWIRSNSVPAQIHSIDGVSELLRANTQNSQPLHLGSMLYLGDEIRTSNQSTIAIKFADETILTIHENSLVRFDHLSAHGVTGMVDTRLNILKGRTDTKVTPAVGPGSRFEIQTPSAISSVRGTIYRTSVSENGKASNIEVLRGKVAVSGANEQQLVNAGYGTQVVANSPPLPPRPLLAAPLFDTIPKTIEQIKWRVSWSEIQDAVSYRIELANNAKFDTLIWQDVTQYRKTTLPDIPDGNYSLRVRAIDSLGIEGLNQDKQVIINAYPQPPVALKPIDSEVLRGQTPILQWTGSENASNYHLEIATDINFEHIAFDKKGIIETYYKPTALTKNGHYYWRLSSIASDGEQGPTGPIRSYQIKPIPAKVEATVSAEDDGLLVASWRPSLNEYKYKVQIANNKSFTNIVIDELVTKPRLALDPIKGTTRYLRVKSIEEDGYEGPWGTTQSIAPLPDDELNYWPLAIGTIFTLLKVLL